MHVGATNMQTRKDGFWPFWKAAISDFQLVIVALISIIFVCSVIYLVYRNFYTPNPVFEILGDSLTTPWGIATSIFVHVSLGHISANVLGLFTFFLWFFITSLFLSRAERRTRALTFVLVVFSMAILANALWIVLAPQEKSVGASGMVYAAEGSTFGFAFFNLLRIIVPSLSKYRQHSRERRHELLIFSFFNLGFLVYFFATFINPASFLNLAPGVNVFVHYISFMGGFLLTVAWSERRFLSKPSSPSPML